MKTIILFLLKGYKKYVSSILKYFFGGGCIYNPTCSEYSQSAIKRFGILKGLNLTIKRFVRCNSLSNYSQFDPVPERFNN